MTSGSCPIEKLIELCAEGAKQFGDNPRAIADFVESGISQLPQAEQRQVRHQLALLTDQSELRRPVS
ncbi:hypothetical protein FS815_23840 [Agrobacterium vitis]|uniref:hypothetical protein n=1 Tax=Allorhizobium ampelinum TaxID=3025782 RepID=UPI001F19CF30|nr:hypothetical protein [Allorhizobium ampelinum]MCF1449825.1 hypothetical protein [Allorhizobium ampelinum]